MKTYKIYLSSLFKTKTVQIFIIFLLILGTFVQAFFKQKEDSYEELVNRGPIVLKQALMSVALNTQKDLPTKDDLVKYNDKIIRNPLDLALYEYTLLDAIQKSPNDKEKKKYEWMLSSVFWFANTKLNPEFQKNPDFTMDPTSNLNKKYLPEIANIKVFKNSVESKTTFYSPLFMLNSMYYKDIIDKDLSVATRYSTRPALFPFTSSSIGWGILLVILGLFLGNQFLKKLIDQGILKNITLAEASRGKTINHILVSILSCIIIVITIVAVLLTFYLSFKEPINDIRHPIAVNTSFFRSFKDDGSNEYIDNRIGSTEAKGPSAIILTDSSVGLGLNFKLMELWKVYLVFIPLQILMLFISISIGMLTALLSKNKIIGKLIMLLISVIIASVPFIFKGLKNTVVDVYSATKINELVGGYTNMTLPLLYIFYTIVAITVYIILLSKFRKYEF